MYINEISDDLIECPICKKHYRELNNAHLNKHNLSAESFNNLYKNYSRLSKNSLLKKNHFKNITDEVRQKLKKSHTIEGYISKYGEELGRQKFNDMKFKKSYAKSDEAYKKRYGENWKIIRENHKKKCNNNTLSFYKEKYGDEVGIKKYNERKKSHTIEGYISKYGEIDGLNRWYAKNKKNSESSRKVKNKEEYIIYTTNVRRFSEISIRLYNKQIINIDKRSKQFHIDHKVSILEGYLNNINPKIIGCIFNLEILSASINCSKQHKNSMKLTQLIDIYNSTDTLDFYKEGIH